MPTFSEIRVDDTAINLPYRTWEWDIEQPGFQPTQDVSALQQVVLLAGGGYVIVYGKLNMSSGDWNLYVQRFDANGAKVGAETIVSTQPNLQYEPVITALSDGGYAVAYSQNYVGPAGTGVFVQVFNADGTYRSGPVYVDVPTEVYHTEHYDDDQPGFYPLTDLASPPQIITLAGGGFVVIFGKYFNDGRQWDVYARRFDDNGVPQGNDFLVNSPGVFQFEPRGVALEDGGFVIVWTVADGGIPPGNSGVFLQIYNADGSPRGGVQRADDPAIGGGYVTTYTDLDNPGFQPQEELGSPPRITALEGGGFVVIFGKLAGVWTVHAQVFAANGAKVGGEIAVSSIGTHEFMPEITALADGGFAVTWVVEGVGPFGTGIFTRTYNADGSTRGGEIRVDDTSTGALYYAFLADIEGAGPGEFATSPQIVALTNGKFVVVYGKVGIGADANWNLYYQVFDANGDKDGGETVIAATGNADHHATLTALENGLFTVTWHSEGTAPNGDGLFTRMFSANDAPGAQDDAFSVGEDGVISGGNLFADNGSGADSDGENDAFVVTEVNGSALNVGTQITLSSGALLTVNANGTFAYDPNGAFNPAFGASETDSFSYTIDDSFGGTSTATVTLTINGVNIGPVATDDAFSVVQDGSLSGNVVVDNGGGVDSDFEGHSFVVTSVEGQPSNVGAQITLASGALLTVNGDGTFDYDPNGAFDGLAFGESDIDVFIYEITDSFGGSDLATVVITINGANTPPAAMNDVFGVSEGGVITGGNVLADNGAGADSDTEEQTLTISAVNGSALNVGVQVALTSGALLTVNANGAFDYDPNGAFDLAFGESDDDTFTYTIDDGFGGSGSATATITVTSLGQNLPGTAEPDNFFGSAYGDLITGAARGDVLSGENGRDEIYGGAGNDTLNGGNGNDTIDGGLDADQINAGDGGDTLYGRSGGDALNGDGGADTLFGGDGGDTLNGGAGDDLLDGLNHDDTLYGSDGSDTLYGRQGADSANGDEGNDTVFGGDGNDTLNGSAGDDLIDGGNNDDTLSGDAGADEFYGRQGNDILLGGAGADALYGGDGDDTSHGGDDSDLIDGGNGVDTMRGDAGDDVIYGRNGGDVLDGGLGADTLYGGNDADTFVFSSALGGGNIDTIDFRVSDGDQIRLHLDVFTAIDLGGLGANAFAIGAAATTADHRIIYDPTTGALYYDEDGDGAVAAVQFATLSPGLAITAVNFVGGP